MASAAGVSYGVRALEALRDASAEIHLVMTGASQEALGADLERVRSLSDHVYAEENQAAPISRNTNLIRGYFSMIPPPINVMMPIIKLNGIPTI